MLALYRDKCERCTCRKKNTKLVKKQLLRKYRCRENTTAERERKKNGGGRLIQVEKDQDFRKKKKGKKLALQAAHSKWDLFKETEKRKAINMGCASITTKK